MTLCQEIYYWTEKDLGKISASPLTFLKQLTGLNIFDLTGTDSSRTRVVSTLIHGNEPSGFIGCHHWLLSQKQPATNLRLIICYPEAAQFKPVFSNRYLENKHDLNRCFSQDIVEGADVSIRAMQIKQAIMEVNPEAVIDLHNTSGESNGFAVSVQESKQALDLVSLFTHKLILTGLHVGALMEQQFNCPVVTIECGGANQISSHQFAISGLKKYFFQKEIFYPHLGNVEVYRHPIRIELEQEASVGFSHSFLPTSDITLRSDIEQLNNQLTPKGELMGWIHQPLDLPIRAIDEEGVNQVHQIFETHEGCLFAKKNMQLFMATPSSEIATSDCLFYVTFQNE